ncbi:tRNA threonylcarbamoyl adenosine modification protein YeaZ [Antricoccus suffuscus]|uniref:tRNA threonylcarbamoyl adenosine modification protein YeaZ n=2 Tax=Antricoccus suffuscus TaxID=1629062 RepID=A0A2T0Z362_9ACTN|nr:tRNA threonylcarbamoyl adenosine modification protein YeaZ [Antricoccus suffuscus]
MKVLAIDTSTSQIVTGVLDYVDGEIDVIAEKSVLGQTAHGELLAPSIQQVLSDATLTPSELDAVVIGLGPGPFTGLRVGIVTGSAMADALRIPAYGTCSLDAIASDGDGRVMVVSDARRKEIYYAVYDERGARILGPEVDKPDQVVETLGSLGITRVLNAGADKYVDLLSSFGVPLTSSYPRPAGLLRAAIRSGEFGGDAEPLTPLYLRRPDAKLPAVQAKSPNGHGAL